jgi:low affinity Fe/Cu permease
MMYRKSRFSNFAKSTARAVGHPFSFFLALIIIGTWGLSGFLFGFSDTWQLVINTATTIVTFLMVFVIQNTQNRDNAALQLKVDEILRALEGAHNAFLDLEEVTEEDLERIRRHFVHLACKAREDLAKGWPDTGTDD